MTPTFFSAYVRPNIRHERLIFVHRHFIKKIGLLNGFVHKLIVRLFVCLFVLTGFFYIRRGTNECGIEGGITAGKAKVE